MYLPAAHEALRHIANVGATKRRGGLLGGRLGTEPASGKTATERRVLQIQAAGHPVASGVPVGREARPLGIFRR